MERVYENKVFSSFSGKNYAVSDSNLVSQVEEGYDGIPLRILIDIDFLHLVNDRAELQRLAYNTPDFLLTQANLDPLLSVRQHSVSQIVHEKH